MGGYDFSWKGKVDTIPTRIQYVFFFFESNLDIERNLCSKISLQIETNEIDDGMMLHYYYFFLINPVRNRSVLDKIASLNNSRSYLLGKK